MDNLLGWFGYRKKRGELISLKSVGIEMQRLFLFREPSGVLFADGLPYVLCLDRYNLPRHPIWPCVLIQLQHILFLLL